MDAAELAAGSKEVTNDENSFKPDNSQGRRLADFIGQKATIGKYTVKKIIGAGANGLVALVRDESDEAAVMKVAMNLAASASLFWESDVMDRLLERTGVEDRTRHIVRKLDSGCTPNHESQEVGFVVMENLPGNPVGILGYLSGNTLLIAVCSFGLQLLKAIYDLHYLGIIHRDIKPENVGLYKKSILVLYDLGMARFFTDSDGNLREPRSHVGMRGTDEWASLGAELGRDQGRCDDLWGWLYVLVEWVNCASRYPLAWAPFDSQHRIRQLMKTPLFPAKLVLRNCPPEFYKIHAYLRSLGRNDSPNYFYLANILSACIRRLEREGPNPTLADARKQRRQRYARFFEVELELDREELHHIGRTLAARLDLQRIGLTDIVVPQYLKEPKEQPKAEQ